MTVSSVPPPSLNVYSIHGTFSKLSPLPAEGAGIKAFRIFGVSFSNIRSEFLEFGVRF